MDKINQEYEKYVSSNERNLYGLELKESIIGCIGIEIISSNTIEIKHIAVSPSERGKGIGSQMILILFVLTILLVLFMPKPIGMQLNFIESVDLRLRV